MILSRKQSCVFVCVTEVQQQQASLVQLQEEVERQRAQMEQMELDKDSQLSSLREELHSQTQQLDGCQARVSQSQKIFMKIFSYYICSHLSLVFQKVNSLYIF